MPVQIPLARYAVAGLAVWMACYTLVGIFYHELWSIWVSVALGSLVLLLSGWINAGAAPGNLALWQMHADVCLASAFLVVLCGFVNLNETILADCDEAQADVGLCSHVASARALLVLFSLVCGLGLMLPYCLALRKAVQAALASARCAGGPMPGLGESVRAACSATCTPGGRSAGRARAASSASAYRTVQARDSAHGFCDNRISNTKYTVANFLVKNLWLQFSRFMNVYFLLIACLQLNATLTPVNPLTTWIPLLVIFSVSAAKELYDDVQRAKRDGEVNRRPCQVARGGQLETVASASIRVGDIVLVTAGQSFPADAVLLWSSNEHGVAYVETANLDGETDLKQRVAPSETAHASEASLVLFDGTVTCAAPNAEVYRFDSRLNLPGRPGPIALSATSLLLQGTVLRNTARVYGLVVYTGNETKMGMNKRVPGSKETKLDGVINRFTVFIFSLQLTLAACLGLFGNIFMVSNDPAASYLDYSREAVAQTWSLVVPLRFLLLISYMIPISLKVTLDMIKFYAALLIGWDAAMYDEATDTPAAAISTALAEDLGQIRYILTDKTGTLTENVMKLVEISVGGTRCVLGADPPGSGSVSGHASNALFEALAVCHTARPLRQLYETSDQPSDMRYEANSPDELALVEAARNAGVALVDRTVDGTDGHALYHVRLADGSVRTLGVLHVLEFSSDRKRMSVIIRDAMGRLRVVLKGADAVVLPRLAASDSSLSLVRATMNDVASFASRGLRTLLVASRALNEDEYVAWHGEWRRAATSLEDREQALARAYDLLERAGSFELLGATAIEDRLQDLVPETIGALRGAGIRFWMLTGDKYATAVQIAKAANLMSADSLHSELVTLAFSSEDVQQGDQAMHDAMGRMLARASEQAARLSAGGGSSMGAGGATGGELVVAIDGLALSVALRHYKQTLLDLTVQAHAVLCCRTTPAEKALVVRMVKEAGLMTLAIGDGGNDVSMIQEAHVGVGISGREGLQAARAADYSFARFKFLRRLLLVHGRWAYVRTAFISQYCFYKSLYICSIQMLYNWFAGFSGVSFFDTFALTTYNVVFTGVPVLGYVLDRDYSETHVLSHPLLYLSSAASQHMNSLTLARWLMLAVFHGVLALVCTVLGYSGESDGDGAGYSSISMVTFNAVVLVNQAVIAASSRGLTAMNRLLLGGTVVLLFVACTLYSLIPQASFYQVMPRLLGSARYWLVLVLIVTASCIPLLAAHARGSRSRSRSVVRAVVNASVTVDGSESSADDRTALLKYSQRG